MAHFYGIVSGKAQSKATRCGSKASGLRTTAASWNGAVHVLLEQRDGRDYFQVFITPWPLRFDNPRRVLAKGFFDETTPTG